jgi:hypothetical protein
MNTSSHFISLSTIFVMIIILSFYDTASLRTVMISCTNWEPVLTDLFYELPVVADSGLRGAGSFSYIPTVPVVAGVTCLH